MQGPRIVISTLMLFLLAACVDQNSLTKEQLELQDRADAVVSSVLFEHDLDDTASYNVRRDGFLVLRFDESVPAEQYTRVVERLRSSPEIKGVRAQQGGKEVCKLTGYR